MSGISESPNQTIPLALSFVICDRMLLDGHTGQHSIVGIVTQVNAAHFPVASPPLWLFAELTSGHNETPLTFEIVDVNDEREPVLLVELVVNMTDPRAITTIGFRMPPLTFPEPGDYRVRLLCRNQFVIDRRIVLVKVSPPEQPPAA